jgi:hypothetical protein
MKDIYSILMLRLSAFAGLRFTAYAREQQLHQVRWRSGECEEKKR